MNSVSLGEVSKVIRGITFKPDDVADCEGDNTIRCFRTKNVQSCLDVNDVWCVPRTLVKRKELFVQPGDTLVSTANSWNLVGKTSWVPELPWEATLGGFIAAFRPTQAIDPRYLYYWLSYPATQHELRNCGRQTTNISNLDIGRALELRLPLPALPEQKRIAAILDKADAIRTKRREALAQVDALLRATFLDLFGDPVANPKGWEERRLDLIADIRSGITKGRKTNGEPLRAVPYMRVANVQDGHIDLSEIKTIEANEAEIARFALCPGDILLTEGGDPDKLGRGAVWAGEIGECIHQNHIFMVRLHDAGLSPEYASALLSSSRGKQYFLRSAKQTTGIASINRTQLAAFPMLLPDRAVHDRWQKANAAATALKDRLAHLCTEADALYASLAQRAFRGEL